MNELIDRKTPAANDDLTGSKDKNAYQRDFVSIFGFLKRLHVDGWRKSNCRQHDWAEMTVVIRRR